MVAKSVQTGKKASKVKRKNSSQKQKVPKPLKSCFAAVVPANIKLVYLKSSLLQALAKVPECFREKVVGSFVRIKSVPKACLQKNSYQLQQVIGITSLDSEIHLRLSPAFRDVPLHLLSDGNFTEEECDDVHERVKAGTLKWMTVADLEAKAKILHVDITKHSISKELSMLQYRIDQANEKGWRDKKEEYLVRKQQLAEEVETRLSQTHKVVAGAMESESSVNGPETVEVDVMDSNWNNGHGNHQHQDAKKLKRKRRRYSNLTEDERQGKIKKVAESRRKRKAQREDKTALNSNEATKEAYLGGNQKMEKEDSEASYWFSVHGFDFDTEKWHYFDPQGDIQGPFNLRSLKRWYSNNFFEDEAITWKTGQNPDDDAVRMWEVLCWAFNIE